jgi:hypothetical protein
MSPVVSGGNEGENSSPPPVVSCKIPQIDRHIMISIIAVKLTKKPVAII